MTHLTILESALEKINTKTLSFSKSEIIKQQKEPFNCLFQFARESESGLCGFDRCAYFPRFFVRGDRNRETSVKAATVERFGLRADKMQVSVVVIILFWSYLIKSL